MQEADDEDTVEDFEGEEHICEACGRVCTCEYDPCVCCNYDW